MKINLFDTTRGIYAFEETNLSTALHAHPAIEIIIAKKGRFSISTAEANFQELNAVIINANETHALDASQCICDIFMIEPHCLSYLNLLKILEQKDTRNPIIILEHPEEITTRLLKTMNETTETSMPYEERVTTCIQFISQHLIDTRLTLATLSGVVNLSSSRLSHLFKEEVGLSIQKYISWMRLRAAIAISLENGIDLQDAALSSGFYDPAHFSRRFKAFFGLKPSTVYNSRIVQDL